MTLKRNTIGFIGAGRVAQALGQALCAGGYRVQAIASRSFTSAQRVADRCGGAAVAIPSPQDVARLCDVVFITTPDDAIEPTAASLEWRSGQTVIHCSGALSVVALAAARRAGAGVAGFHPLHSFADGSTDIAGATIAIEASSPTLEALQRMAEDLGCAWIVVEQADKTAYHAAAVMMSNYIVALTHASTAVLSDIGVPPDAANRALLHLAEGVLKNIEALGPTHALTGPIARWDAGVVERHLVEIRSRLPQLYDSYRALGLLTVGVAEEKDPDRPESAERIRALFARAADSYRRTPASYSGGRS